MRALIAAFALVAITLHGGHRKDWHEGVYPGYPCITPQIRADIDAGKFTPEQIDGIELCLTHYGWLFED